MAPSPPHRSLSRITGLEPDPRRPGAVRLLVDGKPFCTVHEGAGAVGLAPGAVWDETSSQAASRLAEEEGAWRALLGALGRRSFSVAAIRRRLQQKGHTPEAVSYAVDRGKALGLLDDAAFAATFVDTRAARGRGPGRLRRDLAVLGVDRALVEDALRARWPEPEEAMALAQQLAERRSKQLSGLPREVRRRRLLAFLARRGFSGAGVNDLVHRVLQGGGTA